MMSSSQQDKRALIQYYQAQHNDSTRMYEAEGRQYKQRRRLEVLRATLAHALPAAASAGMVLDAGSGDGFAAEFVLGNHRPAGYVAVDLSLPKLVDASRRLSGAALSADIESLPVRSCSVDLVLCSEVLEHLPDPTAALSELHRVLGPGGVCLLSCPVDAAAQPWLYRMARALRPWKRQIGFNEHIQMFTGTAIKRLAGSAGFEVLEQRYCGFNFPFLSLIEGLFPYALYRWIDRFANWLRMGNFGFNGRVTLAVGSEYLVLLLRTSTALSFPRTT